MFTMDNTEGFNAAELTELNNALDALIAEGWDEKAASDKLNNAWMESRSTATALLEAVRQKA